MENYYFNGPENKKSMLNALEVLVRVTFEKPNRFVCICEWKDRELPRRAKFLWSAEDKYWYTTTFEHAARLRTYFDKPLRAKTNRVSVIEVPWSSREPILAMGQAAKPHQVEGFNFAMSRNHSYLAFDMGLGKAQRNSSTVYTPSGPVEIGSIKKGDKVLGQDGKPKKVLGVYPQGTKSIYRVTFTDGSYTECCEEHLWSIRTPNQKYRKQGFKVVALKDFRKDLKHASGNKYEIPILSKPALFKSKRHIIHPYILGVLIGDGGLSAGAMKFTNQSNHIYKRVVRLLNKNLEAKKYKAGNTFTISLVRKSGVATNPYIKEVSRLGLDELSKNKFIPDEYKIDSASNRIELLKGLLDTDGYVAKDGCLQFTSASRALAYDVKWLVESLGGVAKTPKEKDINLNGKWFKAWATTIAMPNSITPVTKPEKLARIAKRTKYHPARYIDSVKCVGQDEATCISVEGEHYLTDSFIVTHNTATSIMVINQLYLTNKAAKVLLIVPPFLITNWIREIETFKAWRISTLAIRTSRMIQFGDVTIVPDSLFIDNNLVSMIKARSFDLIVVDEAQRFLTEDSKRTKALFGEVMGQGIVHRAEKVILLSGTPMRRGPMELWPALHALAYNEIDFRSRHKYGLDFCDAHQEEIYNGRTAWNYKGASNLDILKEKIEGSFILTKKLEDHVESLKGLLTERVVVLDAKLTAKTLKLDKSLQVRPPPLEKLVGSQGLGAIAEYRKLLSLEKVKPSAEYVKNILESTEESVLVFLHHTEAILAMEKALAKYNPAVIYGKVKTKDRDDIEKSFQAGKTRVLIANIGTMVGLNLTRASRCVFAESSWSSTDNDQARSRAFRIGQESRVVVDYITLANTLDEYVLSRVIKKRTTINKLF